MPSRKKTSMFMAGFFASLGSFVLICTSLATQEWVSSAIEFTEDIGNNTNGIINVTYGLFEGKSQITYLQGIGIGRGEKKFQVLDKVKGSGSIEVVHVLIVLLLVLGLFCSLVSSGITCYNSVSNPYQTFFGPIGVYAWNGINGALILLAMILSAVNTEANKVPRYLAGKAAESAITLTGNPPNSYGYSYWLLFVTILLNAATIIIIYFYQHARYSKKKEQQRPMESAPKDVILF